MKGRAVRFHEHWSPEILTYLESTDLRGLCEFVQDAPVTPSGSMAKRMLIDLLSSPVTPAPPPPNDSTAFRPPHLCRDSRRKDRGLASPGTSRGDRTESASYECTDEDYSTNNEDGFTMAELDISGDNA